MKKHSTKSEFLLGIMTAFLFILTLVGGASPACADHRAPQGHFQDSRYHLDRSYPRPGRVVRELPPSRRVVVYKGSRYLFHDGAWYRPSGRHFSVITPPLGLFVSFLPPYYATVWVRGVPYYYANNVYYTHHADGYRVVAPPDETAASQTPPPADQLFVYPRNGQDEKQQADDRYQCHVWAVNQTGYDPTKPHENHATGTGNSRHADYFRAMSACLNGRGYTVK